MFSGCVIRLESAFVDFAQAYYKQMAQQVRLHRDQLTTSHQFLKIRHQFKLGFIAEMRFDYSAALKLVEILLNFEEYFLLPITLQTLFASLR